MFRGWNDDLGLGFTAAIGAERYPLRLYDCIYASIASQTSPLKTYYHSSKAKIKTLYAIREVVIVRMGRSG